MVDLSIIIPAYNVSKYIERCVKSAMAQGGLGIEIIVINDGSTDDTEAIVKQLANSDKRIHIVTQSNSGLYRARVRGIEYSNGKYITFIDADDYIDEEFYLELVMKMKQENIDILEYGYRKVSDNFVIYEHKFKSGYNNRIEAGKRLVTKYNSSCANWNKIYSAHCLKSNSYEEDIRMYEEDMLINMKAVSKIKKYYTTDRVGYNYYYRENSITTTDADTKRLEVLKTWEFIYRYVGSSFPEIISECAITYCARLAFYYCFAVDLTNNRDEYNWIINEFNRVYGNNGLKKYRFLYESKNRRRMIRLFSLSPLLCSLLFRVKSNQKNSIKVQG